AAADTAAPTAEPPDEAAQGRELAADAAAAAASDRVVLRGVVRTGEDGRPVRGGKITVEVVDCARRHIAASSLAGVARDDLPATQAVETAIAADGSYRLEVPGASFVAEVLVEPLDAIEVRGQGHDLWLDAFLPTTRQLGLAPRGPVHELDLEVELGRCVRGFVVERASGAPIPHALVVCQTTSQPFEHFGTYADAQGAFAVTGMSVPDEEPSAARVRASSPGFLERSVEVEPAQTGAVTLALDRGVLLRGRVVDPAGRGVAGADVQVVVEDDRDGHGALGTPLAVFRRECARDDGTFTFTLAPADRAVLRASGNYADADVVGRFRTGRSAPLEVPVHRDDTTLVLTLQGLSGFAVEATRPDGSVVDTIDLVVLRRTTRGWSREGTWFVAEPGVDHELRVLALGPDDSPAMALVGTTTCMSPGADSPVTKVVVRLQPQAVASPPPLSQQKHGERVPRTSLDVPGPHARTTLDLTFVDAQTAAPLAAGRVTVGLPGSRSISSLSSAGVLRLQVGPGLGVMTLTVDGYLPRTFRLAAEPSAYVEAVVRMHPER
ncbi:MAG: carboxypeptidase regulatory-like domain-containing protein, partial [Planctomycetes bacterium]|nr:carboxypeptidase regulatory-like domain-containing protein [Planctomycetota bacterium]